MTHTLDATLFIWNKRTMSVMHFGGLHSATCNNWATRSLPLSRAGQWHFPPHALRLSSAPPVAPCACAEGLVGSAAGLSMGAGGRSWSPPCVAPARPPHISRRRQLELPTKNMAAFPKRGTSPFPACRAGTFEGVGAPWCRLRVVHNVLALFAVGHLSRAHEHAVTRHPVGVEVKASAGQLLAGQASTNWVQGGGGWC
jgi:hypothetical protein